MIMKNTIIVITIITILLTLFVIPVWPQPNGNKLSILERLLKIETELVPPVGSIVSYYGNTAPQGWLICNGQRLDKPEYRKLVAHLKKQGLDATKVPDLRGMFLRGLDSGRGKDPSAGRKVGSEQPDSIKSHIHGGKTHPDGQHIHKGVTKSGNPMNYRTVHQAGPGAYPKHQSGYSPGQYTDRNDTNYVSRDHTHNFETIQGQGAHTHSLTIDASGSEESRPKNVAVNFIIKY